MATAIPSRFAHTDTRGRYHRTTVDPVRAPEPRRLLGAISVIVLLATGCAGGNSGPVVPSASTVPTPGGTTAAATLPADGASLPTLGYVNGPVQFSLPRSAVLTATVDQENNVTAVLSHPPATEVAAYLRRTLPVTGFTIVDDDQAGLAMAFAGHGWRGSFTGNETTSAVLLRPQ